MCPFYYAPLPYLPLLFVSALHATSINADHVAAFTLLCSRSCIFAAPATNSEQTYASHLQFVCFNAISNIDNRRHRRPSISNRKVTEVNRSVGSTSAKGECEKKYLLWQKLTTVCLVESVCLLAACKWFGMAGWLCGWMVQLSCCQRKFDTLIHTFASQSNCESPS